MRQGYEVGGLKMADVKSFVSALKISWLRRILCDNGKITKILQIMCPLIQYIKRAGEFSNIIFIQRIRNPFWMDVFKHYKNFSNKCTPVTFDDLVSSCLHYNIHVCRGRKMVCIKSWMDCGIVSIGQLFGADGYLTYAFRRRFPNVKTDFLLYEGFICY